MMGYSIISHDNGYYAFVDGFSSYLPVPGYGFSERLDLDTNFNIIRAQSIPEGMYGYMTSRKINEQSYYLTGKQYFNGFYTETGIQKRTHPMLYYFQIIQVCQVIFLMGLRG